MSYQAYNNEIQLESVLLLDENGNVLIDLAAETVSGKIPLEFITFTESISSPLISGSLVYDGTKGEYEALQLVGNETIQIIATTPENTSDNEEVQSIVFPEFSIHSFQDSSNFSDTNKTPEGSKQRRITINFSSKEAKTLFEKPNLLPTGFVGKIASGLTFEEKEPEEEGQEPILIDNRGLLEVLSEEMESDFEIEETLNDVWIRPRLISTPTRKNLETMTSLQMINYCKDYAVSAQNPVAVNYFFWQDLYGWHFKSADAMVRDSVAENEKVFTINDNIIGKSRIYTFDVISDFSFFTSLSNKCLYSYYERVEPDYYSSPYARLMDDREKFSRKKIIYNYKDTFNLLNKVESGDPFPQITKEELADLENNQLFANDVLYGYIDNRGYNDGDSIRSVLLEGNEIEITGGSGDAGTDEPESINFRQDIEGSSGENAVSNLAHFDSYETNKWQAMFDCTPLDGEILKKIVTEIKQPTFTAKKNYRDKLAYKEQWNIYRYSVCCAEDVSEDTSLMAVIKTSSTIGKNIYRYSWNEVVFIPKIELGNFMGATLGDLPVNDYGIDVDQLNSIPILPPYPSSEFKFSKFGKTITPEVIGDLSGEIFVSGPTGEILEDGGFSGCGITFSYTNAVTRAISQYFADCENPGMTLTFYNDKYSPFLVMEKPNGAKGSFENSSGAYNLNEILNRVVYDESQYPQIEGASLDSILYYQSQPNDIEMPSTVPTSGEADILVGPGINASKDYTDYPKGFASMPIGSYQRISRNSDGSPSPDAGLECAAIPFGHIVKISSVKTSDLPYYGIDLRKYGETGNLGSKTIYYFSATNAQDGKCDDLVGECGIGSP